MNSAFRRLLKGPKGWQATPAGLQAEPPLPEQSFLRAAWRTGRAVYFIFRGA